MIGSTMLTYALYAGMLQGIGAQPHSVAAFMTNEIPSIEDPARTLRVDTRLEVAELIKKSPSYEMGFSHVSSVYGQERVSENPFLRFRIFAEDKEDIQTLGHDAGRMLIRLWDYNLARLKQPHRQNYPFVDVYLCKGGPPEGGGVHAFTKDPDDRDDLGADRSVSTIHIFQVGTLDEKLERVRELAHEYGHASYPAVGTFDAPESWGNGYAAERIYIKWLYDDLRAKKINLTDTMGATEEELAAYLAVKVTPLIARIGANGPNFALLAGTSKQSFDEYLALNSYAEAILPRAVFARAVALGSDTTAAVFGKTIAEVAAEREELAITIPPVLKGKPMWVPLNKGKIKGAKVLATKGAWAKVQPSSETVIIVNPPVD